jgi:uncharacterized repeat protein (TIGR01451 family)
MNKQCKTVLYVFLILFITNNISIAQNGISLYTPYKKIVVPPGETVTYTIDFENKGSNNDNAEILVTRLPRSWDYTLKTGGYSIKELMLQPDSKKSVTLTVNVPLNVNKGSYNFKVLAKNKDVLPLTIIVSERGVYKTEFTSDQINMQGHAKSNFNFTTKLKNQTAEKQVYSLQATPPRGWNVIFKPNHKQATAVEVAPNATSNITVEVKPPHSVAAGSYKIPVQASNRNTSAQIELEVVIIGSYDMALSTPTGLLSSKITAGKEKKIELVVKNTGSAELGEIKLSASKPKSWEVSFEPDTIAQLKQGETVQVFATLKTYEKAIPGDYVTTITARADEANSEASFRISVKTPLLWGWLGIGIVLTCIGLIFWLFKKYGRR